MWTKSRWSTNDSPEISAYRVESRYIESHHCENGDVSRREVKSAVQELVTNEMSTMVEKSVGNILEKTFQTSQRGIRSVI